MTGPSAAPDGALERDLDAADPLSPLRARFLLPIDASGRPKVYLAGNSLGAQPVGAREAVEAELDAWRTLAVDGWAPGPRSWTDAERSLAEMTARIVGARPAEVTTANTLTVNLHLLLSTFFRPSGRRTAILVDAPTFPSDRYAVGSRLRLHGLDPAHDLVVVRPRDGEACVRPDDLEAAILEHGDRLALTLLAGVNYATGQALPIERLTEASHRAGAISGWDLAHAAGNVPMALHDAGVDFAAWCTYKYLNSGPGALAQFFVHERFADDADLPRPAGWWGNDPDTRFEMTERFRPGHGADGWRLSCPPILSLAPIAVALSIFDAVGMPALRERSVRLTAHLADLIDAHVPDVEVITPRDPAARGAQLSIRVPGAPARLAALAALDVVADLREPDIIRMAPTPSYTSWQDVWRAAHALAATAGAGAGSAGAAS
jgi:kynureninase